MNLVEILVLVDHVLIRSTLGLTIHNSRRIIPDLDAAQ